MGVQKLHDDEVDINLSLANNLVSSQFPQWKKLPIHMMSEQGTDNVMFRLGNDKVIRLPRKPSAITSLEKEMQYLPILSGALPINIPSILGTGTPDDHYPFPWIVSQYFAGSHPDTTHPLNSQQATIDLSQFITTMHTIPTDNAPLCQRGKPLKEKDTAMKAAISQLDNSFDIQAIKALWDNALSTPNWLRDPVWIHGDLHAGNVLAKDGVITAIIDFGLCGIGDPAVDLMCAWTLLPHQARQQLRLLACPDDDTWHRARGWALCFSVIAYPYYKTRHPAFALIAKNILHQTLLKDIPS